MADIYDELCERILRAQEEMLKHEVEANTVVLNGKKYAKVMKPGYRPTIFGMALEVDRRLPDDCDFIVQYREPKIASGSDRLRSVSDEEMAAIICAGCPPGEKHYVCPTGSCGDCWLEWLQSPVEVEE